TTGHLPLHEIYIHVKVFVVHLINHFFSDQSTQCLEIHNKTCVRVWKTFDGDNQFKIMAMPVDVGAGAKNFLVPFLAPLRVPKLMGRVEMFFSANVYHLTYLAEAKLSKKNEESALACFRLPARPSSLPQYYNP